MSYLKDLDYKYEHEETVVSAQSALLEPAFSFSHVVGIELFINTAGEKIQGRSYVVLNVAKSVEK